MLKEPRRWVLAALVLTLFLPGQSMADPLEMGHYKLSNHPDGGAAAPFYGLRLDGLLDWTTSTIYTFDFEAAGAGMYLDYSPGQIHIYGKAWGGEDVGDSYAASAGLWDIDFLYNTGVGPVAGDSGGVEDVWVPLGIVGTAGNTGTIQRASGGPIYNLFDYSGNKGYTFRFGDEDDGLGHRDFDGLSGWGWLNHGGPDYDYEDTTHLKASDWLFTAHRVPEPGTLALFGIGAALMLVRGRRKQS